MPTVGAFYQIRFLEMLFKILLPFPVAARSKAWVYGRSSAEFAGSNRNGVHGCLSVVCCQVEFSCDELITRPEESYRLWCVVAYDLETE
jgi:hypothetical protein